MFKFTLGTAQFGMDYGINNKKGKLPITEIFKILDYAYEHNIRILDTASAYGESEIVLGKWIKEKKHEDLIISSKIESIKKKNIELKDLEKFIRNSLENSIEKLGVKKLDYYLIHDFDDIKYYGEEIFRILKKIKKEKIIDNYGCSLYDLPEVELVSAFDIDIIQIPASIFNQSIIENEIIEKLKKRGIKIFVRSVFVQGLILMNEEDIPIKLNKVKKYLEKLNEITKNINITKKEASLNYIRNHINVDSLVFGVDDLEQLIEIINIDKTKEIDKNQIKKYFSEIEIELVDPRYWR